MKKVCGAAVVGLNISEENRTINLCYVPYQPRYGINKCLYEASSEKLKQQSAMSDEVSGPFKPAPPPAGLTTIS